MERTSDCQLLNFLAGICARMKTKHQTRAFLVTFGRDLAEGFVMETVTNQAVSQHQVGSAASFSQYAVSQRAYSG